MKKQSYIITAVIILFLTVVAIIIYANKPKHIAVLYIATGRYTIFWDEFYESAEKNFLPKHKKHYFVFTDNQDMLFPDNVTVIPTPPTSFPEISLMRWKLFQSIQEPLNTYDFVYSINANALFVQPVNDEIFPSMREEIMAVWHPGFYNKKNPFSFPYDRNPSSTAYIPMGMGQYYIQGGFIGGRPDNFAKLTETILERTEIDKNNQQTALWHDESHLNRYILDKNPLIMHPGYIWAPFDLSYYEQIKNKIKIIMRDKNNPKYGGVPYLRGYSDISLADLQEKEDAFFVQHPQWEDWMIKQPQTKNNTHCRKQLPTECAVVEKKQNGLRLLWENYPPEELKKINGIYIK